MSAYDQMTLPKICLRRGNGRRCRHGQREGTAPSWTLVKWCHFTSFSKVNTSAILYVPIVFCAILCPLVFIQVSFEQNMEGVFSMLCTVGSPGNGDGEMRIIGLKSKKEMMVESAFKSRLVRF